MDTATLEQQLSQEEAGLAGGPGVFRAIQPKGC